MRKLLASTMVAALLLPGCSPALARGAVPTASATTTAETSRSVVYQDAAAALREAARGIPLGKKVKVRTLSGDNVWGKLRAVSETGVTVEKRASAISKPVAVEVRYETMQSIEKDYMRLSTKIAIVATVVGVAILGACAYFLTQPH